MRFMKYVGEIWRCAGLYRAVQYEDLGIGCFQDQYLAKICESPGIAQEEIAADLFVNKSNVARQVASLEEKGFVERRPDAQDKRILRVYPTEKALSVLEQVRRIRRTWTEQLLAEMGEEEREAVSEMMERLAERAKELAREWEGEER